MNKDTECKQRAYAIANWRHQHENAHTRKQRSLKHSWMPNYLGTVLYHRLLEHRDGKEILFIWSVFLQVAGSCPQRGLLAGEHGAFTIKDLAKLTSLEEPALARAIEVLRSPEIGWIEEVECPQYIIVSGSLRAGRRGRPKHPEIRRVTSVGEASPKLHIEWEQEISRTPENAQEAPEELHLTPFLPFEMSRSLEPESVVGHSTPTGGTQGEHTQNESLTEKRDESQSVVDHTFEEEPVQAVIDTWNGEATLRPTGYVGAHERSKLRRALKTPAHLAACIDLIESLGVRACKGQRVPRFARFVQKHLKSVTPKSSQKSEIAM